MERQRAEKSRHRMKEFLSSWRYWKDYGQRERASSLWCVSFDLFSFSFWSFDLPYLPPHSHHSGHTLTAATGAAVLRGQRQPPVKQLQLCQLSRPLASSRRFQDDTGVHAHIHGRIEFLLDGISRSSSRRASTFWHDPCLDGHTSRSYKRTVYG